MRGGTKGAAMEPESWRVLVVTNIPGGLMYRILSQLLPAFGHRIVGVVTSPGPPRRRSGAYLDVAAAVDPNVDLLISNHPSRWATMLAPLEPDLILCAGMPWKLPAVFLAMPRLGSINIHPALLPRHRGPYPFEWALRNGDLETGITIHRMAGEFDTGAILAQTRVPILDDDDFNSLMDKFPAVFPGLLAEALARVARGDPGDAQDESLASYAGPIDESWLTIDWRDSARAIHNQVRSLGVFRDPAGALGVIEGETLRIGKTRLVPLEASSEATVAPGAVIRRGDGEILVQCGDAPLTIIAWDRASGV
jgi:methionyl-tRNA formyltransferase